MLDAVLSPRELTLVLQHRFSIGSGFAAAHALRVQPYRIPCNLFQPNAADSAHLRAKITSQQIIAQADAFKNLRTAIRANGADTHLRHDLLQAFIHRFDVVLLGSGIFLLNLSFLHEVVEHCKRHIRTDGTGSIA